MKIKLFNYLISLMWQRQTHDSIYTNLYLYHYIFFVYFTSRYFYFIKDFNIVYNLLIRQMLHIIIIHLARIQTGNYTNIYRTI